MVSKFEVGSGEGTENRGTIRTQGISNVLLSFVKRKCSLIYVFPIYSKYSIYFIQREERV